MTRRYLQMREYRALTTMDGTKIPIVVANIGVDRPLR